MDGASTVFWVLSYHHMFLETFRVVDGLQFQVRILIWCLWSVKHLVARASMKERRWHRHLHGWSVTRRERSSDSHISGVCSESFCAAG
jgi:hypothetical protein